MDNVDIFKDTQKRINHNSILEKQTENAISNTVVYGSGFRSKVKSHFSYTNVCFKEESTLNAAKDLVLKKNKTTILNFANPTVPGGGVLKGANAQEECLCRASNLYNCLVSDQAKPFYQIHKQQLRKNQFKSFFLASDTVIYSRDVTVIKIDTQCELNKQCNCKNLVQKYTDNWFQVDVITCAAPRFYGKKYLVPDGDLQYIFEKRIENIFETAIDNKTEAIVLGAFGCGAFNNPPFVVAEAFRNVMLMPKYANAFREICFAVKRSAECCENVIAFNTYFKDFPKKFEL